MADAWLEELSLEECRTLLRGESLGRIAFTTDELITVLPVNFRVVEAHGTTAGRWLALRTRPGNVIDRASMVGAFEVDGIDASGRQGWSVLVRGTLHTWIRMPLPSASGSTLIRGLLLSGMHGSSSNPSASPDVACMRTGASGLSPRVPTCEPDLVLAARDQ